MPIVFLEELELFSLIFIILNTVCKKSRSAKKYKKSNTNEVNDKTLLRRSSHAENPA
jgi:hypothetical protein